MVDQITYALMEALEKLQKEQPSREVSLAITKVQEALYWWSARQ